MTSLLDLVAEHMVEKGDAPSAFEAINTAPSGLAYMEAGQIIGLLARIKVEALPFSSGVRTFEGACILTEADILAGRDEDCTLHDHETE